MNNLVRFFIAVVESIGNDHIITFRVPGIIDNMDIYPKAFPLFNHTQEVLINDTVLVIQFETALEEFGYFPITINDFIGLFNKRLKLDISDGSNLTITQYDNDDREGEPISKINLSEGILDFDISGTLIQVKSKDIKATIDSNILEMTDSNIKATIGTDTLEMDGSKLEGLIGSNKILLDSNGIELNAGSSGKIVATSGSVIINDHLKVT